MVEPNNTNKKTCFGTSALLYMHQHNCAKQHKEADMLWHISIVVRTSAQLSPTTQRREKMSFGTSAIIVHASAQLRKTTQRSRHALAHQHCCTYISTTEPNNTKKGENVLWHISNNCTCISTNQAQQHREGRETCFATRALCACISKMEPNDSKKKHCFWHISIVVHLADRHDCTPGKCLLSTACSLPETRLVCKLSVIDCFSAC